MLGKQQGRDLIGQQLRRRRGVLEGLEDVVP